MRERIEIVERSSVKGLLAQNVCKKTIDSI